MPKMIVAIAGAFVTHKFCYRALFRAEQSEKWAMIVCLALMGLSSMAVMTHAGQTSSLSEHADALIWILGGAFCLIQVLIGFIYLNGQRVIKELHEADRLLIVQMINEVGRRVNACEADMIHLRDDCKHYLTEERHREVCDLTK